MILLLLACSGAPEEPASSPAPTAPSAPPAGSGSQPPPGPRSGPPGQGGPPRGFHAEPTFELEPTPGGEKRSILFISLDTVRADSLRLYGGRAEMPAVEALGERGLVFDQAMTNFPQTCLSHWTMMTGVLPELHGNTPMTRGSLYSGPTLAEIAGREGYATAGFIGGQTLKDGDCGFGRGFDHYDDAFPFDERDMARPGHEVTTAAARWVAQQEGPWFAFVHLFDAHFPYTPQDPRRFAPDYAGQLGGSDQDLRRYRDGEPLPPEDVAYVRALYDAEVEELDELLAPLLEQVGTEVLVVLTSDHGESFGHDYLFNHKDRLYEGILHVPLVLAGPGVEVGRVPEQFALVDLAPTVLQLAGLPADTRMQGRPFAQREQVYSVTDPWDPAGPKLFAERTPLTKRIESPEGASCYDLRSDPGEASPSPCQPDREAYDAAIASLEPHQVEPPGDAAPVSLEECRRLEALGYMKCHDLPGAVPLPPPP